MASSIVVASFYQFAQLTDYAEMRLPLVDLCREQRVSGGIILAAEGINGSICGSRDSVYNVLAKIQSDSRLSKLRITEAPASESDQILHDGHTDDVPFRWNHVRVKLKKEVVPLGIPGIDPAKKVGTYVKPADWNELISDPETLVIDVRNMYETRIGKFKGAIDPKTESFREFPQWVETHIRNDNADAKRRIATYCTGGIRCEKATAFLLDSGFDEVYHLEGGILRYLEEVDVAESLWEGECFVFDKRVSVEHGLKGGKYKLCYACKEAVNEEDMKSCQWEKGVSCPHCFANKCLSEKERARAREKQSQTWGLVGGPLTNRKL